MDFIHPETGEPLEKICFIGRNGTGKSTLLRLIRQFLSEPRNISENGFVFIEMEISHERKHILRSQNGIILYNYAFEKETELRDVLHAANPRVDHQEVILKMDSLLVRTETARLWNGGVNLDSQDSQYWDAFKLKNDSSDLLIYSPTEVASGFLGMHQASQASIDINDVPSTSLSEALQFFTNFPSFHEISDKQIKDFWRILIYLIKKRENERENFENKPENLNKTKKQLIEEFEKENPKIEEKLAELWNKILDKAGLEVDLENLKKPLQLNDNLQAYIRLKSTKQRINYNQLSTGIRNFIFRIGHIYSLYFNREIKRGFLLVDEPENSLFPDFLFDLMELYQEIVIDKNGENNTQFFVATHSPIVAAQFEPYERIILEWNDNGHVTAHKGHAPVGDDPNDVLEQDFGLENLMGKEGQKMWNHYLELRKKLRHTENKQEKERLMTKIAKIGNQYNFEH